jgi:hypothetical protein
MSRDRVNKSWNSGNLRNLELTSKVANNNLTFADY